LDSIWRQQEGTVSKPLVFDNKTYKIQLTGVIN
jgi:hypothetical protein